MAISIFVPGRKLPFNYNNTTSAFNRYRNSPVGTSIRMNKTGRKLIKSL